MGLRLRIVDSAGQERLRGALENAVRVELEIPAPGAVAPLRVRDANGALLSLVWLRAGGGVELRSGPWQPWPAMRDVVDSLGLAVTILEAPTPALRVQLTSVDQIVVQLPLSNTDRWEVAVIAGLDGARFHTLQSIFSIAPPGSAMG